MDTTLHQPETIVPLSSLVVPAVGLVAPSSVRPAIGWNPRALDTQAVTIRELEERDASSLCSLLTTEPVTRFIYPPPTDRDGFARFIQWTRDEQRAGRQITFAIVPTGQDTAAGIIQVRQCDTEFSRAEWGFVLGQQYWGTGLFMASADIVLRFLFECVGVQRLEARSVALNGRGNRVLQKLGATQEGCLRRAFSKHGKYLDEVLWTLVASDWRQGRRLPGPRSH